jgi:hypothetical protein
MRTRSRRVAVIVLVLALALLTSGCFQIRLFKIQGRYSLPPGLSTAVQLDLYPASLATGIASQVVILIGLDQLNYHSRSSFDLAGNWGGPMASSQNNTMRDLLRTVGNCQSNGIDAGNVTGFDEWYAFVSNDVVDTTGLTWADLANVFRLRIRVEREAGTTDDSFGSVMVFAGFWADDGDSVAETGEAFCNSMVAFSIPFRSA